METTPSAIWPLVVYFVAALGLAAVMIGLPFVLGQRHDERATGEPYESGIRSSGSAHLRFSAKFYLIALFFVIFDLEAVFVFAWAVSLYDAGWSGYIAMALFIAVLLAALVYLWRLGALDWTVRRNREANDVAR